jgi:transposase
MLKRSRVSSIFWCSDDCPACGSEGVARCGRDRHAQRLRWTRSPVQTQLEEDPFSGQLFVFRGKAGDRVKILWWSGDGLCLFAKRLERGRFVWPQATHGTVSLSAAQLSMLLEGIDWRRVERTHEPHRAA